MGAAINIFGQPDMTVDVDHQVAAPTSPFSIDDEGEVGPLLAATDADELEGNYSSDDGASLKDDEGHADAVRIMSRTNMLMRNFNEYMITLTGEDSANYRRNTEPTLYRDFIDMEGNETPSYEDVERELQMQGRYPKRKIAGSLRNFKRVKRGIVMIVIATIIIGVSVGVITSKKKKRLPDWNQELEDQIESEGITGDGLPGAKPVYGGEMGYDLNRHKSSPPKTNINTQHISETHKGSSVNHHAGSGPYNQNDKVVSNQPHQDNAHQILNGVTHTEMSTGSTQLQLSSEYQDAQTKYKPVWFDRSTWTGTTYQQAEYFCSSRGSAMEICPYEAICPLGPSGRPIEGTKNEPLGSWAPVNNDFNTWVQVGLDGMCLLYSYSKGHAPDWGLVQDVNELQTRHVVCCPVDDTAQNSAVDRIPNIASSVESKQQQQEEVSQQQEQQQQLDSSTFYNTEQTNVNANVIADEYAQEWNPTWYEWIGKTYEQAAAFCKSLGDTSDLCYYSVICPTGPNHLPYGGEVNEAGRSWAPIKDSANGWVQVGGTNNMCVRYMTLYLDSPSWGNGEGDEELTRHLPCCTLPSLPTYNPTMLDEETALSAFPSPSNVLPISNEEMSAYESVEQATPVIDVVNELLKVDSTEYNPVKYDRQSGWVGASYNAAIVFCASQGSRIPCFYESYCPNGENEEPFGGVSDNRNGAWAPIMDAPNSWVQIGKVGTCQKYNDIHSHPPEWGLTGENSEEFTTSLLCCDEPDQPQPNPIESYTPLTNNEKRILNNLRPLWFGRSDGYRGSTHEEAELFCSTIAAMQICPIEAYCPNGPTLDKPLYLQRAAFKGEQWAPVSPLAHDQTGLGSKYVMVGTMDGDLSSTCMPYESLHTSPLPPWSNDGSETELKEHVMCCESADEVEKYSIVTKGMSPVWLGSTHGWSGGSHLDAQKFCNDFGGKELCPYAVYCPDGAGKQPLSGHGTDFNSQGIQYSPIYGDSNSWVMIGQKDGNAATTCMLHSQLEGFQPDWGLNKERQEIKNHILCCNF